MATDAKTEAALEAKQAFYSYIETLPEAYRGRIEDSAWGNSWADGAREEYNSDEEAWVIALETAKMMADAPADFGLLDD